MIYHYVVAQTVFSVRYELKPRTNITIHTDTRNTIPCHSRL